ncbi:MAG: transcriptional regulator [Cellulosilyticaceae bacterium]
MARLLKVDLNTLLSFNEDLSEKEVANFTNELVATIQQQGFEAGYKVAMVKMQEYPTCDMLIYMIGLTLEGSLLMYGGPEDSSYRIEIEKLYERVAHSENDEIRHQANAMLIARYMEREEYEKAQSLIDTLPKSPVDKMQRQAQLYVKQGKLSQASELLESRVMSMVTELQMILVSMLEIAVKEDDINRAEHLANISRDTATLYDLWEYNKYMAHFQLGVLCQDTAKCMENLEGILIAGNSKWDITQSPLYRHIQTKDPEGDFNKHVVKGLIAGIEKDESCNFLRPEEQYISLLKKYNQ